jgi:hypothetical protein
MFANEGAPSQPIIDLEILPADLSKEEALKLAIGQSELKELGRCNGLVIHYGSRR